MVRALSGNINNLAFTFSNFQITRNLAKTTGVLTITHEQSNGSQPIFKLPVELLCDIFAKYIEDERAPVHRDSPLPLVSYHCRGDPMVLGQVCSTWRDIALNMPSLWSTILIDKPKWSQLNRTKIWLERSRSSQLTLSVVTDYDPDHGGISASRKILSLFASHITRWHKIDFRLSRDMLKFLHDILSPASRCTELAAVSLYMYPVRPPAPIWEDASVSGVWSIVYSSPTLRKVTWNDDRAFKLAKNTPFSQLTHLDINLFVAVDEILEVLAQCYRAEEITIRTFEKPSLDCQLTSPIVLPYLRTFKLYSSIALAPLYASMTFGSLETLLISYDGSATSTIGDVPALSDCLERSSSRLSAFILHDRKSSEETIVQYLSMPSLASLKYLECGGQLSQKAVNFLNRKDLSNGPLIMPALETLLMSTFDGIMDSELKGLVLPRWNGAEGSPFGKLGRLQKFSLTSSNCVVSNRSFPANC